MIISAPLSSTAPIHKTSYFETNHNNKLACDMMLHIERAPSGGLQESVVQRTVFTIRTLDNSFPDSQWKLIKLIRLPLVEVNDQMTIPSHGMEFFDFVKWFMTKHELMNYAEPVAVYYYTKIRM